MRLPAFLASPPPAVGLELSATRVTAVALSRSGDAVPGVSAHATVALPPGALVPSLTSANAADRGAVGAAIRQAVEQVGGARRLALVVPDTAGKVSLVRFEKMPSRAEDLEQLVRWQVRKAVPFPIETAQVSWSPALRHDDGGQDLVVAMMRRDIVEEYEALCAAAGAHAGLVDLASFSTVNLVLAGDARQNGRASGGDWMLVHLAPDYVTVAVVRRGALIFHRVRPNEEVVSLSDLVHQTAMYAEDRLGGGTFGRVVLSGDRGGAVADDVRRDFEERLQARAGIVDLAGAATLTDRIALSPELAAHLAAPVGALLRD
jgi:type IV pilus assembly protein PilM